MLGSHCCTRLPHTACEYMLGSHWCNTLRLHSTVRLQCLLMSHQHESCGLLMPLLFAAVGDIGMVFARGVNVGKSSHQQEEVLGPSDAVGVISGTAGTGTNATCGTHWLYVCAWPPQAVATPSELSQHGTNGTALYNAAALCVQPTSVMAHILSRRVNQALSCLFQATSASQAV